MLNGNIRLGRIGGVEIRVNWSWLVIFALIVWSLEAGIFPSQNPGLSKGTYLAMAVAAPFQQDELLAEVRSAAPYAGLKDETFEEILNFIATGGYALKAYDRFRRLVPEPGGMWRIARPQIAQQHRLNAGVIVEQPLLTVRFRNGRKLGTIEEGYASTLSPGDHF